MLTVSIAPHSGLVHRSMATNHEILVQRGPAWRWQRASDLIHAGRNACRRRDDLLTLRAVDYVRAWLRAGTARRQQTVIRKFPEIHSARCLAESPREQRWMLEASLLAGLQDAEIARRLELSVDAVRGFAELFYDVRPGLEATDWVLEHAIFGRRNCERYVDPVYEEALRLAYQGGPQVLEAVIECFQRWPGLWYEDFGAKTHESCAPMHSEAAAETTFADSGEAADSLSCPDAVQKCGRGVQKRGRKSEAEDAGGRLNRENRGNTVGSDRTFERLAKVALALQLAALPESIQRGPSWLRALELMRKWLAELEFCSQQLAELTGDERPQVVLTTVDIPVENTPLSAAG
ncbi:MAG: hypothetical protein K1X74_02190 [Pirellulales bacterium]|nr:hypothetical protein [Pirellulales bacterium]